MDNNAKMLEKGPRAAREGGQRAMSMLPEYSLRRFRTDAAEGSSDMVSALCPRKGCGLVFWVTGSWLAPVTVRGEQGRPNLVVGRSCPYCARSAAIPEAWLVKPTARRRRIVRRRKSR